MYEAALLQSTRNILYRYIYIQRDSRMWCGRGASDLLQLLKWSVFLALWNESGEWNPFADEHSLSTMVMYIIIGIKIGGDIFNNWKTTYGELCQQSQMWCLWYVNKFVRGSMCLRIVIQDVEWSIIIWLSMWFLFGLDNHLRNSQQDIYLKCLLKVHSWFQMYP